MSVTPEQRRAALAELDRIEGLVALIVQEDARLSHVGEPVNDHGSRCGCTACVNYRIDWASEKFGYCSPRRAAPADPRVSQLRDALEGRRYAP